MRSLTKQPIPGILKANRVKWLAEFKAAPKNRTKRFRYRAKAIKTTLKEETGDKCIYCESKIGHNTPGDVEHLVPSSKNKNLHFRWSNLSIACTECNRRKNNYYKLGKEFLNPYREAVEDFVEHQGPIVYWKPGNKRAEITLKTLELNNSKRVELINFKIGKIEELQNLYERYISEPNVVLKEVLGMQLSLMADKGSEYSGMVLGILQKRGFPISQV